MCGWEHYLRVRCVQVVFAGFSAESLSQRILDCQPNIILTSSAVKRAAKIINLKDIVDDALQRAADQGHVVGEYISLTRKSPNLFLILA